MPNGLPAPAPLLAIGLWVLRSEPELILKSRRVVPGRLLEAGFEFRFPEWPGAAEDLVRQWRDRP
jgi:NAD dependent epimerase/dehydratase family enzyme